MKRMIQHKNYEQPFEDRRNYMEGDLKPMEGSFKSWFTVAGIPIITVIFIAGTYFAIVRDTAAQTKENKSNILIVDNNSKERDSKLDLRTVKLEEAFKYVQGEIPKINEKLDKVLTKVEYR